MGYFRNPNRQPAMVTIAMGCLAAVSTFFIFVSISYADECPFMPGERLIYTLRWAVVPAGEAVLEVMPITTIDDAPAHHFRLTATSNAFVDMFYKVRDRVDAYANLSMTRALRYYKKQHEGSHRKNVQLVFNWRDSKALYFDGKTQKEVAIRNGTFDPLSGFYFTRMADYKTDGLIVCPITDGKKWVYGEARIVKKERVTVYCGSYDTYLMEPDLKHVGGVFKKQHNAKIKIWVTADDRRIPVKFASKVSVGSFVGELSAIERPHPLQASRSNGLNASAKEIRASQ